MASLSYSLGGSAWLTIYTLAQMRVRLRLGYVGVVGRVEAPGLSFTSQMDELGIDRRWVGRVPDLPSGICLSYIDDTDRAMLTHPGANFKMAGYIRDNFDGLADYLASARFVHVTSFLDDETPAEMLRLLARAKELNPGLALSFDPGFDWAQHGNTCIDGILALTDLLFVNYREFKALGRSAPGEPDTVIAAKALARCAPPQGVLAHRCQLSRKLPEAELEDATGAGDVFAAAVLASLTSRRLQVELGALVGLSLARHKMRRPAGVYQDLPDLSNGFLQVAETLSRDSGQPQGVFVIHDSHPEFHALRLFIEERCGLAAYELGFPEAQEDDIAALMERRLGRCGFAVCLLSAGATFPDGRAAADQRLVYQAGVFQGRYGFSRVAILCEDGCDTFSNIAGLIRLDFPRGQVDTTFFELERILEREGLIRRREDRRV